MVETPSFRGILQSLAPPQLPNSTEKLLPAFAFLEEKIEKQICEIAKDSTGAIQFDEWSSRI